MKVELYHTSSELKQLFRKEKDAALSSRLRAVYLALMGKSAPEIAALLGYRRRTIQNWIYAYNKHGLERLQDTPGRGQRCKLNTDQLQWLRQRLEEGPPPRIGPQCFSRQGYSTVHPEAVWGDLPSPRHLQAPSSTRLQLCVIPARTPQRRSTDP